ncbi:STY4526/YPO1902 family pathogenicity island replication protein [Thiomicrorhabdus indica]|uniref:STY4526/YPO1902 family pathogenicity island replication protein n=1 Tax=Thiomicrorhabdus indica TaxID=2267253 RepID=UPI00102DB898|nr:STY4526/YPO1902 family pathogenicity island replication protein [Thiomicrorhabdus indica]
MANFQRDMLSLVIKQICQQSEDGRLKEVMAEFDLTEEDIKAFSGLHHSAVERLSKSRVQPFKITPNKETISYIKSIAEECALQERAIKLAAPNDFLARFFGISSREAFAKRVMNGVDAKRVKRVVQINQEKKIIEKYLRVSQECKIELTAKDYCDICEELLSESIHVNLKVVWLTIEEYRTECALPVEEKIGLEV